MSTPGEDRTSKRDWRSTLLTSRRRVPAEVRAAEAHALARAIGAELARLPGDTVCGYVPVGTEPGSLELLDTLLAAGRRVLLPVVLGATALDWAEYQGPQSLVPTTPAGEGAPDGMGRPLAHRPAGLVEPAGQRLGPAAVGMAAVVLVPALAVDRRGVRLGKGGGHYDRSLPLAAENAELIAVVRDAELVERLPTEPHDVLMTAALTPQQGLITLRS